MRLIHFCTSFLKSSISFGPFLSTLTNSGGFDVALNLTLMVEKHGRWSEILVTTIPDFSSDVILEKRQKIWSMRVALLFENLVGSIICGRRPFETKQNKVSNS